MSARDEILKKINSVVKQKKEMAQLASRQKTIAQWVSEFFSEVEATKNNDTLVYFALTRLTQNLHRLDRKCTASFEEPTGRDPVVKIFWSRYYIEANNCEDVTVLDASTAHFQAAMEQI